MFERLLLLVRDAKDVLLTRSSVFRMIGIFQGLAIFAEKSFQMLAFSGFLTTTPAKQNDSSQS